MRKILSCEFNPDTACVELRLDDGTLLAIDCTAVENEVANGMYQRSELDWLIYNNPLAYAELILNGDPELYLKAVTMAICYDRLFHLMIDKKISNAQLKERAGFSANIITRLKRNEYVSIESVERICRVMECGVDDILEFVPEEKEGKES